MSFAWLYLYSTYIIKNNDSNSIVLLSSLILHFFVKNGSFIFYSPINISNYWQQTYYTQTKNIELECATSVRINALFES